MKRKHLLFLLLFALMVPWAANAQTVTIGEGTNAHNSAPIANFYNYSLCEMLFTSTEIGQTDVNTIIRLGFKSTNTTCSKTYGITVYMKNVDAESFTAATDYIQVSDDDIVFTGSLKPEQDCWNTITLDNPFTYDDTKSLLVVVNKTSGGYDGSNNIWSFTSTSSTYKMLYAQNDSSPGVYDPTGSPSLSLNYERPNVQLTFGNPPTCVKPTLGQAEYISEEGASFQWTENGSATQWQLQYSTSTDFTDPTTIDRNGIPAYAITGLSSGTTYYVHLRSYCGDGEYSDWSNVVTFTTLCSAYNIPYTYGFEEAGPFECWTVISGTVTRIGYTSNTGTYRLDFRGTTSNMVALPEFNNATNTLRVEFWTRPESTGGSSGKFAVGYMTDITDASTFVAVETYNSTEMTQTYVKKTVDLVNAPANASIAMRQFDCQTNYYWYVDDVTVKEIPSCVAPTALAADASTNSAELSWTANSGETAWTVYYKKTTDENYTEVANATNPYTLNGLTAATNYQYYVVANCSADDASEPSEVFSFATECEAIAALDYTENFDSYTGVTSGTTNNLPLCWNYINTSTYNTYKGYPVVYNSSSNSYSGNNYLRFYSYAYYNSGGTTTYDPQDQYAILPEMEGLAGMQVRLMARGYNANSTFKIGTMSDPTDASTFTMIAEQTLTTSYQEFEYLIPTNCTDSYLAIMIDAANSSRTTNSVYIDDIVIVEAPTCIKPTGLAVTDGSITNNGATITWTAGGDETRWQIEFATDADFSDPLYEFAEGEPTYTFHGINESTTYYVHVQSDCGDNGESEYSNVVSFTTLQTAANLPYSNDFESENGWIFVNGNLTNAWAYGEATSNGEGSHALYISNDGGTSNAYTVSSAAMVYATKLFNFEEGTYVFSYDWKANGESSWDFLRVALVPSTITLNAGTSLPSGLTSTAVPSSWIALDGGSQLQGVSAWQSYASDEIEIAAGTYMMVFAWRNDGSGGTTPPAAIDNVSIEVVTCATPTGLAATVTTNSAEISWNGHGLEEFNLRFSTDGETWETVSGVGNPYTLQALEPATTYYVQVQPTCADEETWSANYTFTTPCEAVTSFPWSEDFETRSTGNFSDPCWVNEHISGNGSAIFNVTTVNAHGTSTKQLILPDMSSGTLTKLMLPEMTLPGDDYQFVIDVYRNATGSSYTTEGVRVFASTDGEIEGATELGFLYRNHTQTDGGVVVAESEAGWYTYEFPIEFSGTCYIILRGESKYGSGTYMDNFKVRQIPSCSAPTALEVTATTTTTATLSWTNGENETAWQICLNGDETNLIMANSNPFTIEEGLTPGTRYSAKVRAYCSDDDQSEWSNAINFDTDCEPYTITEEAPYTQDFESPVVTTTYSQIGEMPICWDNYPVNAVASAKILAAGAQYNYASEGQVLYFYGNGNNYAVLPEFTNPLNTLQISFKYATESSSNGTLTLGFISEEDENFNTFEPVSQFTIYNASSASDDTFVDVNPISLQSLPANATRLVFRWYYSGQWGCNVDDVEVSLRAIPSFTKEIAAVGEENWESGKGGYYLIASPLDASVNPVLVGMITDDLGSSATTETSTYDLYSFDQTQDLEWQNFRAFNFNIVGGQGYLYASKNGVTLTFTGDPTISDACSVQLFKTDNTNVGFQGWNLVGNPLSEDAYIEKPFYTLENSDTYTANEAGTAIHAMQGLFVVADEDGEMLTFTNEAPSQNAKLNMNLRSNNKQLDNAILVFSGNQQLGKMSFRENSSKIYMPVEGKDYAIATAESSMGEMPVSFKAETNGSYTLSFTNEEVSFSYLHLIDNLTGVETDLLETPSYSFEAKTTDYANRFKLVFATGNNGNDDNFAFFSNGNFVINNEGNATLQVIDVTGRILSSESINGCASVNVNAAPGVYMIRLVNGDNVKVQKVVVR